jgi:uncharacterized protein
MLYRKFGPTKENISILGFGCMRLPVINGKPDNINEDKATKMLHYAVNNGVNYVDTAYPYHGAIPFQGGQSEVFLGKALKNGYREKVKLATKLPSWLITNRKDMDYYLNQQLKRLQTDQIDFYLIHGLNQQFWGNLKHLDVFEFLDSAIADGRIVYAGFSFHDEFELFKQVVDSYGWTFCQIQYNFMDQNYQAGQKGLDYAVDNGLGIVIMEPLRGGSLVKKLPPDIQAVWDKADKRRSPAEWALRYLWDQPEIDVVLSGMTEMEHVVENIKIADQGYPKTLTENEKKIIEEVRNLYESKIKVNCVNCHYCIPCPAGVNIPLNLALLNDFYMYEDITNPSAHYHMLTNSKQSASNCDECGKCEELCSQLLPIREKLKEVVKTFEQ